MKIETLLLATCIPAMSLFTTATAAMISVDSVGTNITNESGSLVPFIWQQTVFAPENNNADERFDWLAIGKTTDKRTYDPGQIQGYNLITGNSLPQPATSAPFISDDNASGNASGYSLTPGFGFYVTAHFGGYYSAWYVEAQSPGDTYKLPSSITSVGGATAYGNSQVSGGRLDDKGKVVKFNGGGLSNVRIWQAGETDKVPDGGTTLLTFGIGLLGLGGMRRFLINQN